MGTGRGESHWTDKPQTFNTLTAPTWLTTTTRCSFSTLTKMFKDYTRPQSHVSVRVFTMEQLRSLQEGSQSGSRTADAQSPLNSLNEEPTSGPPEVLFLTLTYETEYDSVHFPFGVTLSPSHTYSPSAEISRLRSALSSLLSRLSSASTPPRPAPQEPDVSIHNLSSPTRARHNSVLADLNALKRQYDSLKTTSEKHITHLERQLRATAYTTTGVENVGRVKLELRQAKEELGKERRRCNKLKDALKDARRSLQGERAASRGRERARPGDAAAGAITPRTAAGRTPVSTVRAGPKRSVTPKAWSEARGARSTASSRRAAATRGRSPSPSASSVGSAGSRSSSGRRRFDPTSYVRGKKEREAKSRASRGYDSDSSGGSGFGGGPPRVKRVATQVTRKRRSSPRSAPRPGTSPKPARSAKLRVPRSATRPSSSPKPRSGPRTGPLSAPRVSTSPYPRSVAGRSPPVSKLSPRHASRRAQHASYAKDDEIFGDIEEIDKRLQALQGFLKEAQDKR